MVDIPGSADRGGIGTGVKRHVSWSDAEMWWVATNRVVRATTYGRTRVEALEALDVVESRLVTEPASVPSVYPLACGSSESATPKEESQADAASEEA